MTGNRTTEQLAQLLDERGVSCQTHYLHASWCVGPKLYDAMDNLDGTLTVDNLTPEQAVTATLGARKARAHTYGYEPDTGAFDATRCECGCINDISATYCNDCGGEIEVDVNAEKEIYKYSPRNSVFATKHDDGSLEFGGKRYVAVTLGIDTKGYESLLWELVGALDVVYATDASEKPIVTEYARRIAATLGSGTLTAEQVRKAIFNGSSYASYDGAKYYADGIGMQAIADELNAELGSGTCEIELRESGWGGYTRHCGACGADLDCDTRNRQNFCPNCGRRVKL